MRKISLILLLCLFPAKESNAYWLDGNHWYAVCFHGENEFMNYFMEGVGETEEVFSVTGHPFFCVPNGVTLRQLSDIFCNYLAEHPESRQYQGASLAMGALAEKFPCSSH